MINFLNTPPRFSPVYTDGLFFTVSADTNHFKFRYVYDIYVDNVLIFQGKATPNPFQVGVIDVSKILKSYVSNIPISKWNNTPIYTHQTFPFSRPNNPETINYQVFVGYEYASSELAQVTGFTGNGNDVGLPSVTDGLYKTFQSTMGVNGKANEQNFNIGQFVLSGTPVGVNPTVNGLFLTNSPRHRDLDPSEHYTLGFTNYYLADNQLSEPYYVLYNFYDDQGSLITGVTIDNITTNGGGPRTNCNEVYQSTVLISPTGNTDFNTLYVGAGPMNLEPIMPPDAVQYTIQLFGKFTGTTSPIQPTPTPTPTPTPSPAPNPCGAFECGSYSVSNLYNILCQLTYWDCQESKYETLFIAPNTSSIIDCTCPQSFNYQCDLLIQYQGPCPQPEPTPSLTPTHTPTPSITPLICVCNEYTITNTSESIQAAACWTTCDGDQVCNGILPGQSLTVCACANSVSIIQGVANVSFDGPC